MPMKKKSFVAVSLLLVLVLSGCFASNSNEDIKVDTSEEKEEDAKEKNEEIILVGDAESQPVDESENKKARKELEKLTDAELKELLNRVKHLSGEEISKKITKKEIEMLSTLAPEEYWDLMGLTEEEIYNLIAVLYGNVNSNIIFAYQNGIDSDEYNETHRDLVVGFEPQFRWIDKNYEFETEYHNNLIKDIIVLTQKHANGNNEALFALNYTLLELNSEYNPDKLKEIRATSASLSDIEKIRNGKEPRFNY